MEVVHLDGGDNRRLQFFCNLVTRRAKGHFHLGRLQRCQRPATANNAANGQLPDCCPTLPTPLASTEKSLRTSYYYLAS